MAVEKINEERTKSTRGKKEKKRAPSPWNYLYFIHSPFPLASKAKKVESKQYLMFVKLIKKIHVNISLVDLITCVPKHYKFVKEIIAKQDKVGEKKVIPSSDKCNCISQKDW